MSVSQAQACIDSREFSEWQAFHNLYPFTLDRSEYMLSVVASILANVHRKKGATAFKPSDFIPKYGKRVVESVLNIETKLRALFHGNNK